MVERGSANDDRRDEAMRILLLQDHRGSASAALEDAQALKLQRTGSPREAMRRLKLQPFDLMLVDLGHEAVGCQTIARLRELNRDLPIAALSCGATTASVCEAVAAGADECIETARLDANALERALRMAIERRRREAACLEWAHHDPLTGLPKRTLLEERFEQAVARAGRDGSVLALLLIGIDGFRAIRAVHGPDVAEVLLAMTARRLRRLLRRNDTLTREEHCRFALLTDGARHRSDVYAIARKVLEGCRAPFDIDGMRLRITVSIGIEEVEAGARRLDGVLARAEQGLLEVTTRGGDGYSAVPERRAA